MTQALVGSAYNVPLSAKYNGTNEASTTFTLASPSKLPDGLSITNGAITGTPVFHADGTPGYNWEDGVATFHPEVDASYIANSGHKYTAEADYTLELTLPDAPVISVQTGYVPVTTGNQTATYQVLATAPSYGTLSYSLPQNNQNNGWSINSTTGVITGRFTTAKTLSTTVTITDSATDQSASALVTLVSQVRPSLSAGTPFDAIVGQPYKSSSTIGWPIPASGTSLTLSATGLPAGLSVSSGKVTGTPTVGDVPGAFTFTVTATNSLGPDATKDYTLNLYALPVFTTPSLTFGVVGDAYTQSIAASGNGVTFGLTPGQGPLPSWLTLHPDGSLTGTPTEQGSWTFKVRATNKIGHVDKSFTVQVLLVPTVTTSSLPNGQIGVAYSSTITASGTTPQFTVVDPSKLPSGLSIDGNGNITGTPTTPGTYSFEVYASNEAGDSSTATLSITVPAPVQTLSHPSVSSGGTLTVMGSGFKPGEGVQIWVHSDPVLLTTVTADGDGNFSTQVTIPSNLPAGAHEIESLGLQSGVTAFTPLTVTQAAPISLASDTTLAHTGSDLGAWPWIGLLALVLGIAVLIVARRRRDATDN